MGTTRNLIKPAASLIAANRANSQYNELSFPAKLGPHSIVFNFSKYDTNQDASTMNTVSGTTSIALPIPSNLVDSFSLRVAGTELEATGAIARQAAVASQNQSGDLMADLKSFISGANKEAKGSIVKSVLSDLAPANVIKGAEVGVGALVNPHLALTFDGIDLKTHTFNWQLAPHSSDESESLKKIVRKIKHAITPSYKSTGAVDSGRSFLQYPDVVDIFFLGSAPGHMYYFKRCMVSNFEVNYAGGGSAAFVQGGKPAVVNVSMSLTEMEIHTKDDYEEGPL